MGNGNSTQETNSSGNNSDGKSIDNISSTQQEKNEKTTENKITLKAKKKKKREGREGFHLEDWLKLVESTDFKQNRTMNTREVTRDELRKHTTENDCWTVLHGRVYDITLYLNYHPGGKRELMKGAGKDCTALFNKFHAYVEYELILSKCEIGILVEGGGEMLLEGNESEEDDDM